MRNFIENRTNRTDLQRIMNEFSRQSINTDNKKVNIKESSKNYTIQVAMPGVEKDDLSIDIKNGILKIAIKKESKSDDQFVSKDFMKRFELPKQGADINNISAEMKLGVLKIEIPKIKEFYESKQITIS